MATAASSSSDSAKDRELERAVWNAYPDSRHPKAGRYFHLFADNGSLMFDVLLKQFRAQVHQSVFGATLFNNAIASSTVVISASAASTPSNLVIVEVVAEDLLACMVRLMRMFPEAKVVGEVFGSEFYPGGGTHKGSSNAQDESINYCCPTLYVSLKRVYDEIRRKQSNIQRKDEPWLKDDECVYVPSILICRNPTDADKSRLDKFDKSVDLVYLPALREPWLTADESDYKHDEDKDTVRAKIRLFYRVSKKHGKRILVTGAWGCVLFKNPPQRIVELFLEILDEAEFANCFDRLVFAMFARGALMSTFEQVVKVWQDHKTSANTHKTAAIATDEQGPQRTKNQRRRDRKKELQAAMQG